MPDETNAEMILTQLPLENCRRPPRRPVVHGWRLSSKIWNTVTSPWMKQLRWLRIVHSGDWCLRFALRTPSVVCHKQEEVCTDISTLWAVCAGTAPTQCLEATEVGAEVAGVVVHTLTRVSYT